MKRSKEDRNANILMLGTIFMVCLLIGLLFKAK